VSDAQFSKRIPRIQQENPLTLELEGRGSQIPRSRWHEQSVLSPAAKARVDLYWRQRWFPATDPRGSRVRVRRVPVPIKRSPGSTASIASTETGNTEEGPPASQRELKPSPNRSKGLRGARFACFWRMVHHRISPAHPDGFGVGSTHIEMRRRTCAPGISLRLSKRSQARAKLPEPHREFPGRLGAAASTCASGPIIQRSCLSFKNGQLDASNSMLSASGHPLFFCNGL